jgi:hypothetical protein
MEARELEIKEKWVAVKSQPDEYLKKIAKDLYNGLIFCDHQCPNDIMRVFIALHFIGPRKPESPKHSNDPNSVENKRDNALYDALQRDADQEKYEEDMKWYKIECKYYEEVKLKSIGLIYEYLSAALPISVNGKPIFFSLRLLNHDDTKKMFEYYNQYIKK